MNPKETFCGCLCQYITMVATWWKCALWNLTLVCSRLGCLSFYPVFFFTIAHFCANNEKYNYLQSKCGWHLKPPSARRGGTKWIQIETWSSYAWFHFSEKEFILDKESGNAQRRPQVKRQKLYQELTIHYIVLHIPYLCGGGVNPAEQPCPSPWP